MVAFESLPLEDIDVVGKRSIPANWNDIVPKLLFRAILANPPCAEGDIIGHFHSAGVPCRAELFETELNYPAILRRIDALGYQGCFGLEYFPRMEDHRASREQIRAYLGA